jgi:DNA polymerase/3'-5' exonuclease PolX
MTDKIKHPRDKALAVAQTFVLALSPFCERVEIAGSIRRKKPEVGDIELLFIPKTGERDADMFTKEKYDMADDAINKLLRFGTIRQRPNIRGSVTWGTKNKLAVHVASGIPIDFFATTGDNWFTSLVIRTGGKDTNLLLTTSAQRAGNTLNAYGAGITTAGGKIIRAESEQHLFELCGVKYIEPEKRR